MTCRNVSLVVLLLAGGLLSGCDTYYSLRRDIGIDPVDPPPANGTVNGGSMNGGTMNGGNGNGHMPAPQPMAAQPMARAPVPSAANGNGEPAIPAPQDGIAQSNWAAQRNAALTGQDNTPPVGYQPEQQASAEPMPVAPPDRARAAMPPPKPGAPLPKAGKAPSPTGGKPAMPPPGTKPAPAPAAAGGLPPGYHPSPAAADAKTAAAGQAPAPHGMKAADTAHAGMWRAHIASFRTEEAAIREWEELLKAEPKLYGQFDPLVVWADIPRRGAFARLTMGEFADRKAAEAACQTVRSPRRYCAPLKE